MDFMVFGDFLKAFAPLIEWQIMGKLMMLCDCLSLIGHTNGSSQIHVGILTFQVLLFSGVIVDYLHTMPGTARVKAHFQRVAAVVRNSNTQKQPPNTKEYKYKRFLERSSGQHSRGLA